jgi:ABC-type uncharacterized transport system permease subunit
MNMDIPKRIFFLLISSILSRFKLYSINLHELKFVMALPRVKFFRGTSNKVLSEIVLKNMKKRFCSPVYVQRTGR